ISELYLEKLLKSRMMVGQDGSDAKATATAKNLTESYVTHGFCINIEEARSLGLTVEELEGDLLDAVWHIHLLDRKRQELLIKKKQKEMEKKISELPPELLEGLPSLPGIESPQREVDSKGGR